jgi:hypothetical protein
MSMPRTTRCSHCGAPPNFGPGAFDAQRRGRDTTLECAAIRLTEAIAKLGETQPEAKVTYFEASPTKDAECYERWVELNESIALVKRVLADRKGSESDAATKPPDHG